MIDGIDTTPARVRQVPDDEIGVDLVRRHDLRQEWGQIAAQRPDALDNLPFNMLERKEDSAPAFPGGVEQ